VARDPEASGLGTSAFCKVERSTDNPRGRELRRVPRRLCGVQAASRRGIGTSAFGVWKVRGSASRVAISRSIDR
jgi:hypothetical protein